MTDIRARIAEVLREQRYSELQSCCPGEDEHAAHVADVLAEQLGLTQETHWGPICVFEFDDAGNPVMDDRVFVRMQKSHFEWVDRARWVTPWLEVGPRETSAALDKRLERDRLRADDETGGAR